MKPGPVLGIVGVAAGLGVGWYVLTRSSGSGAATSDRTSGDGWESGGAILTPAMVAWLDRLAAEARRVDPTLLPIYVTSGVRTAAAQAAAVLKKAALGDDLHKLYADDALVDAILAAGTLEGATAAIEAAAARGRLMSDHMSGHALDLRIKNYSTAQRENLVACVANVGGDPHIETTPPHCHVEGV